MPDTVDSPKSEQIILPESPEAASYKTVSGWVSGSGHFWADDERMARWDGSTHDHCSGGCGVPVRRSHTTICGICEVEEEMRVYAAAPRGEWNGADPLYIQDTEEYVFDRQQLEDHCLDEGVEVDQLRVYLCEPLFAASFVLDGDHFADGLPEDGDLPSELVEAINNFNTALKNYKEPLCWAPTKTAAIILPVDAAEKGA